DASESRGAKGGSCKPGQGKTRHRNRRTGKQHPSTVASVKAMIRLAIQTAKRCGRKIGICGQAPSDYPNFARFLVEEGIDSISLNPDAVIATRLEVARTRPVWAERAS
ncbi:MAG: hypothetical protein FJ062_06845, partial [Cyanobacteria bacterium M_DeepCast_100m_m1_067]|nr:hypothetical protein [Cyanobacteria bacterium M_DeepCast_100m_m1_067]